MTRSGTGNRKGGSPLVPAGALVQRIKMLLYGPPGAGKTMLALGFPGCAVIDMEGGANLYGQAFQFDVLRTTDADEVMATVRWLLTHEHDYSTLVIDPITVYWEALQKKWSDIFLRRNHGSKGFKHDFYDLQPRDWMTLKSELKELVRLLIALDMNIIVTAREKFQYADAGFMRVVGETFDGEKSLPYMFDTILRLSRDEDGRFIARSIKDRSNRLPPGEFEVSYALLEQCFGRETLTRSATPIALSTEAQREQIRDLTEHYGLSEEQVDTRLRHYGAETLDELTHERAQTIIEKLKAALAARDNKSDQEG